MRSMIALFSLYCYYLYLVCNQPARSTHPFVVAKSSTSFAGVKAGMSLLPGDR